MEIAIFTLSVPVILAIFIAVFLYSRGHETRSVKLKFPFMEVDTSRFKDLSAYKLFTAVSIACISPSVELQLAHRKSGTSKPPVILIHIGWTIVCDAFIARFDTYPTDTEIHAAASHIGGQNAEFIKMFRDINSAAIKHPESVRRDFANDYILRAPALFERILGRRFVAEHKDEFIGEFLRAAWIETKLDETADIGLNPDQGRIPAPVEIGWSKF